MPLATTIEEKLPHLNQISLADIWLSCGMKYSRQQYSHVIACIEEEVNAVTRSMLNSTDHGFVFLKLAIHPGSTPERMAVLYEKVLSQTPWKYKPTAVKFIDAIDTLFKFYTKDPGVISKFPCDPALFKDKEEYLDTLSELTLYYIVRLVEHEKTALAS